MKYALIVEATGLVTNVTEAEEEWQPQEGYIKIPCGAVNIGDTWDGTQFIPQPEPTPIPPNSGHPAILVSVNTGLTRPVEVKRLWNDNEYFYNCLASQSVVNDYLAGKIAIGDYLWIEFINQTEEIGGGEAIVITKVYKSW